MFDIIKYTNFLYESKFWYKTISDFLEWIENNSDRTWIFVDTETTGLRGPILEQLTQVSGLAVDYDSLTNEFKEKNSFNKKIKLTDETKIQMKFPSSRIKNVLKFNRYGEKEPIFLDEDEVLNSFYEWVVSFDDTLLVIQNAQFDMKMLNVRGIKHKSEILDTKEVLQMFYLPTLLTLADTDEKYKNIINMIGTSERDNGLINSSMSKIGPLMGIDMTNYHDALNDCRITMQMFNKIIDFLKTNKELDIRKYQNQRIKTKKSIKI
jgi:DNA polymerase III epsilon subunit-like protein